ncbi:MAG: Gfo/Idh/MocA family oxidoreductase [candidate division WS1 bacterium]|jgi:predicted dehydrogenase|nr:Gfo/Idh/MocA family oxidoreductase [candidate division WS1 bacterium]
MGRELTAAVIGASGIGKHHAKWFQRLGCEMGAFAGTSPESVARTAEKLQEMFGFQGTGYPSAEEMFSAGTFDMVSVCSPEPLHYDHFMRALDHGAHVICEKPLVYDPEVSDATMLSRAEEMVEAAEDAERVAAVNTQYVAAVDAFNSMMAERGVDTGSPETFFMQMESRGGAEGTDREQIFIDLGPHPLSVLMGFCGPGHMDESTVSCVVEQKRVDAEFDYVMDGGATCRAHIVCCNRPEGDLIRRFGINDVLVDYEGRNDDQGVYRAYLMHDGEEVCAQDFVEASLEQFVNAVRGEARRPLATAADGLQNLRMQLALLAAAESR